MPSSFLGKIFHFKTKDECTNGHYCIVIAEDLSNNKILAVKVTSKPRKSPRTKNAVYELTLDDIYKIFPRALYGVGEQNWHKESKIFFADTFETDLRGLGFRSNLCPQPILDGIISTIKNSYPYVITTEYMNYFISRKR